MDFSQFSETSREQVSLSEIVADLERKIAIHTGGRIRDLRCEEVGDSVVLCGRTSTYYIKQLASQIAMDESRTLNFQNSIEVV
ncbi:hypothetical protein SH661x_001526 [Planctomicrobium sp. SH661]|uniref:hypothetical protein n=1 Tax=Planctomicrobium sp. SH661 TaxID=3448124 RepID=UPI003F5BD942